ncbi:hypothetical protein [Serpentinicella alkaliphila]|uniref:Uncharacterized protein n=1 Tax=Serpentinicella alkaliphila TaxID=1734049 RepID=A0A4R2T7T1_9FIRM|nr:hypothetical protein [Serpentinicella alkaliphila]QUH26361.1 hypothetical protein HZR23_11910 [Serpentinicella alkaliphila]TCP97616.1 hypothetical protein EDD79_104522 [Serpentinicella alkaliphila]
MSEELHEKLNGFSKEFYNRFKDTFNNINASYEYINNELLIKINAQNESFGSMSIYCSNEEAIVFLGEYFHTHFNVYLDNDDDYQKLRDEVISETLNFVKDVFDDKVVLEVQTSKNKLICSSVRYTDENEAYTSVMPVNGILRRIFSINVKKSINFWSRPYIK